MAISTLRLSATASVFAGLAIFAGCSAESGDLFGGTPGGENGGEAGQSSGGTDSGGSSSDAGSGGASAGTNSGMPGGHGGGNAGAGANAGSGGNTAACEPADHDLAQRKTYLEFVIDTSGSMAAAAGDGADRLSASLSALSSAFPGFPSATYVGATLFSGLQETSSERCYAAEQNVPFTAAFDASDAFQASYEFPGGGTPTHNAVHFGLEQLRSVDGDRYLFLITDGAGNYGFENPDDVGHQCTGDGTNGSSVDQGALIEEVRAAQDENGIYTFVAGLPGSWSQFSATLSQLARVGGTPNQSCLDDERYACHLNFDSGPQDFRAALEGVLVDVADVTDSCLFRLPGGANPGLLNVKYNDTKLLQHSENCDDPNAYAYIAEGGFVYLCQDACAQFKGEAGKVTATLLCPDEP
jgi:hypothetical protein